MTKNSMGCLLYSRALLTRSKWDRSFQLKLQRGVVFIYRMLPVPVLEQSTWMYCLPRVYVGVPSITGTFVLPSLLYILNFT